ncbi:hydroxyethylthiazole kinase [Pelagirhabdus alkalitolerans]|uniref:Hydroxyethylthiazole kinase n=1 Tax=Pelagirhabdus alkalitolerans TaxID=1612202 RepID=A0A1G6JMU6_9BACI|nr:hydroxyethylthiazole kinase [Pelagirhabdus alkalitolerans]SDC19286.1 hydroxyethylthiazole kinase [Pelagirhabdus alkalitolerans]
MNNLTLIQAVKDQKPLVHNITNQVVMNFSANGLYAIGAQPVMAHAREEVVEMASNANALVLNIGTLTGELVDSMILAGQAANKKGTPVVLDPVGVGATHFRTEAAKRIIDTVQLTAIRGNAGEISQLAGIDAEVRGVDATGEIDRIEVAKKAQRELDIPIIVTGETDVIVTEEKCLELNNGTPLMTQVTGTGCLLTAVVAAFLSVSETTLDGLVAAVSFYTIAAEVAAQTVTSPGSFQVAFLDALSEVGIDDCQKRLQIIREERS